MYRNILIPIARTSNLKFLMDFVNVFLVGGGELTFFHVFTSDVLSVSPAEWRRAMSAISTTHHLTATDGMSVNYRVKNANSVAEGIIEGLDIKTSSPDLEAFKPEAYARIRSMYTIENVKDDPGYRAYRDFFWRVGIDPTKTRPASEALVRRILADKPLPTINTAVDAYNLASALSGVPIAAFDADRLCGSLTMRMARVAEQFKGIGMKEPIALQANQVVIQDEEQLIAVYPYRDSDGTKVTPGTQRMHVVSCGVPGIGPDQVMEAYEMAAEFLEKYSGGIPGRPVLSPGEQKSQDTGYRAPGSL
jgi:DNA/RNA-binding domain of Phe-tRNA-synthetase-like protein